jgi:hypothetical protein
LEDDVLDGDAASWVATPTKMLESGVGVRAFRVGPSPTDREGNDFVERCTESDNSGTDAARVVGRIQPSTLNDSHRNTQQTASPTLPFSRKRRVVALVESPPIELDVSDDQISCRRKVSRSPPSQNRRATQKRRPQGSPPEFPMPGLGSRFVSSEIPSSPGEEQHDVNEGVVWEYRRLLDYRIINGKSSVLVPWVSTWEPLDEYPEDEVDRVRREYQAQMQGRRRGRPRSKQHV